MKSVYFDNAATTPLRQEVIEKMTDVLQKNFGNPSSTHAFGRTAKSLVEQARKNIAKVFNVSTGELVFTSGGTEADNFVLRGCVKDLGIKTIITSRIEHHAVLHTAQQLASEFDVEVKYVNLDEKGAVDYNHLESLLEESKQALVSLMHVNNEIGNVLDIQRTAELCKQFDALFHSDTVQSVGHYTLDLQKIPIDFLAVSAHKFHGPKGVGFAFIRKGTGLKPLIIGGEQERGYRAGTESVHNIIGLETALTMAYKNLDEELKYIEGLKGYFIERLKKAIPDIEFNGYSADFNKSKSTILNVRLPFPPEKSDTLLFQLDLKGIACSKGSACQSGSDKGSHVLTEILDESELSKPSLRFSFSKFNTPEEVDYVVSVLESIK